MKLSIVIVNWNSKNFVRGCLQSLRKYCLDLDPQVIVVDGGSFDGCNVMIEEEFPEVEFIQSQENIGFGRSNNLGVEKATGEALLLLNPDTEVTEGAIQSLLESLQNLEKAGIIGARQLNTDGSLQLASILQLPKPLKTVVRTSRSHKRYFKSSGALNASEPIVVEAISGACMMMKLELFRKVGGFSPEFFMYVEDIELCLKVTRAGFNCIHNPHAVIKHHSGCSSISLTKVSRFGTIMRRESLCLFFKRENGLMTAYLFRIASFFSATFRTVVYSVALVLLFKRNKILQEKLRLGRSRWWIVLRWAVGLETAFVKSIAIPSISENST